MTLQSLLDNVAARLLKNMWKSQKLLKNVIKLLKNQQNSCASPVIKCQLGWVIFRKFFGGDIFSVGGDFTWLTNKSIFRFLKLWRLFLRGKKYEKKLMTNTIFVLCLFLVFVWNHFLMRLVILIHFLDFVLQIIL